MNEDPRRFDNTFGIESAFCEAIKSGDKRKALEALRDVLAESMDDLHHSIKSNSGLCRRCGGSLSEAGLASLAQRLKQTLDDLDALGDPNKELSILDQLTEARNARATNGVAGAPDSPPSALGTKHAPRRQGGRRAGGERGSDTGPVGGNGS
jgi:hypothetical protein